MAEIDALFDRERFDIQAIRAYAAQPSVRDRFWLLGGDAPFLLDPSVERELVHERKKPDSVYQLIREAAAPRAPTLWDHTLDAESDVPFATAALYLLADAWYGLQDGSGYNQSPLSGGIAVLVAGETLFQTLAANLLPYNSRRPIATKEEQDLPAWEIPEPVPNESPAGWLEYATRP